MKRITYLLVAALLVGFTWSASSASAYTSHFSQPAAFVNTGHVISHASVAYQPVRWDGHHRWHSWGWHRPRFYGYYGWPYYGPYYTPYTYPPYGYYYGYPFGLSLSVPPFQFNFGF